MSEPYIPYILPLIPFFSLFGNNIHYSYIQDKDGHLRVKYLTKFKLIRSPYGDFSGTAEDLNAPVAARDRLIGFYETGDSYPTRMTCKLIKLLEMPELTHVEILVIRLH